VAYQSFITSLDNQKVVYTDINIRPSPLNTILWTANIDTKDAYLIGNYSFFDTKEIDFEAHPKNHQLLGDLKEADKVKRLIAISEGWYTISEKENTLYFNDLRFGLMSLDPEETQFAFSYELNRTTDQLMAKETPKFRNDAKKLLALLWQRIFGN
jgi:inner membrane protein